VIADLGLGGRPNTDRNWTECFAQLVGTVLSLWDAAALDAAGQDGEVAPTFINLADASIKMVRMDGQPVYLKANASCRLKHFPPEMKMCSLSRTSCPSPPQARTDTSSISTPFTLLRNGRPASGCPCSKTHRFKNYILAR
jgi:hypothetical protein